MGSTIAAIHVGLTQLGIDEFGKRALYDRITGKAGLTAMSTTEQEAVLTELRRLGFAPASKRANGRPHLSGRYAQKLQALWIAAYNLGLISDRDDRALEAFVKRQTGLERERFLHHAHDAAKVIEALKAWLKRDGGVDWTDYRSMPAYQREPGYKIARAQWARLHPAVPDGFWPAVATILADTFPEAADIVATAGMTAQTWIAVMNDFGARIREGG